MEPQSSDLTQSETPLPPNDIFQLGDIWGMTPTEDQAPTYVPARFEQQYRIVANGGSSAAYIYDQNNHRWLGPLVASSGGGGTWTKVASGKLVANAALILDTGTIVGDYDMFRITVSGIREGTLAGVQLQMRLNADAGANYTYSWLDQYNAVAPDVNFTTANNQFGITNGQSLGAGDTIISQILVGKNTAGSRATILAESSFTDIGDSRYVKVITSGYWTNGLGKITQIQLGWFTDASTYWLTGSTCLIEGFISS